MSPMLGARWDEPGQNARFQKALERELVDYAEVNSPIPWQTDPSETGLPVIAHTSSNPTCSAHGIDSTIAELVREGARASNSPWIGEHLSWLGSASSGSLGYQINPLFTRDFHAIAVENILKLKDFYDLPLALELSPIYTEATGYESEMHFLGDVAVAADTSIILDVTHWQIANKNLNRTPDYGLDALPRERIIELHIAGMRQGSDGFWHDSHGFLPPDEIFDLIQELVADLPSLRAVTYEHLADAPEEDFYQGLERLRRTVPANEH